VNENRQMDERIKFLHGSPEKSFGFENIQKKVIQGNIHTAR